MSLPLLPEIEMENARKRLISYSKEYGQNVKDSVSGIIGDMKKWLGGDKPGDDVSLLVIEMSKRS